MARILIRLISIVLLLWAHPAARVVAAPQYADIPGKADLIAFFNAHVGHGLPLLSIGSEPPAQVTVGIDCAHDGARITRAFDDERTPIWLVPADRSTAVRAVEAKARGMNWSAYVVIGPRTDDEALLVAQGQDR
jgi:hypothetical protein